MNFTNGIHFRATKKAKSLSYLIYVVRALVQREREREVTKTVDRDQTLQDWNWKFQKAGKKVTCIVLGSFTFCLPKQC